MYWGPQRGVYKNVATEISFFVLFFTVVSVSHKEWPNSSGKNNLCIFIHYFVSFDVRFAEFFLDGCLVSQRPHGEHNAIPANTNIFYDCNLNSGPFHFQSGYKERCRFVVRCVFTKFECNTENVPIYTTAAVSPLIRY